MTILDIGYSQPYIKLDSKPLSPGKFPPKFGHKERIIPSRQILKKRTTRNKEQFYPSEQLLSYLVETYFNISSVSQRMSKTTRFRGDGWARCRGEFLGGYRSKKYIYSKFSLDSEKNILMTCLNQEKEDRIDTSHNQATTRSGIDIVVVLSNMPITL